MRFSHKKRRGCSKTEICYSPDLCPKASCCKGKEARLLKTGDENIQADHRAAILWITILFLSLLSRKFFEQLPSRAISLDFVMELVDVVPHCHQENLG